MLAPEQAGRAVAVVLSGAAAFQLGLSAGAPWGAAAWGGRYPGVLPPAMRVASGGAAAALALLAGLAATPRFAPPRRRLLLRSASAYFGLGTVANALSPSPPERVWAPVNVVAAALLWRASGESAPRLDEAEPMPGRVRTSGTGADPDLRH